MIGTGSFYTLSWFNTRDKHIESIARRTEQEVVEAMKNYILCIPSVVSSLIDYPWTESIVFANNDHNGYAKQEDGTEWFFVTSCYRLNIGRAA